MQVMHGCLANLVLLLLFAALISTALAPAYIALGMGVAREWAMLIGAGGLGLTLFGLYRWILAQQKKERKVRATLTHPIFGEVRQLQDHWEASVPLTTGEEPLEIWGDSGAPTAKQEASFRAIHDRLPALLSTCLEEANAFLSSYPAKKGAAPPVLQASDLVLGGISLEGDAEGDFSLNFEIPDEKILPWGLSITFEDFKVAEVSDNH